MELTSGPITAQGQALDIGPSALGELVPTSELSDVDQLRERLRDDGYVYMPGFFPAEYVLAARHDLLDKIAGIGWLESGSDPDDALPSVSAERTMLQDVARASSLLQSLLYSGRIIRFYAALFGGPVRHFDFTWLRAYPPGPGTGPHMDSVFMNRGTLRLMTAWLPIGDIDLTLGGLAILEGSHRLGGIRNDYGSRDVDTYCSNREAAESYAVQESMVWNGLLSGDPVALREELGLRWLTAHFHAGDLVTFPLYTVHIGLDNNSDHIRLSSDSRYQPAGEPADPRWTAPTRVLTGRAAK